tara:strand:- start:51 stop:1208 length:1158 start_codon:yes stop_codon:yes gene_type:complete
MALKNNTWKLNQWYDQSVAGNISYSGAPELWSWGYNDQGGLGQNNRTNSISPVQVPGTTWSIMGITSPNGNQESAAIKTDGTLWTWGYNEYGQMGDNSRVSKSSPTQIPGTTWATVKSITRAFLATKTDGTLWGWGRNDGGTLGQNEQGNHFSSPVQIPGTNWSTDPRMISGGGYRAFVGRQDGTMWCMGDGNYGRLGLNNYPGTGARRYSSPVQLTTATNWTGVSDGTYGTLLLNSDGEMFGFGDNDDYGSLGLNDTIRRSSPTQVPGTWGWISASYNSNYAIKTDGSAYGWGNNNYGQLGQNDRTVRSSPVQIPGTWSKLSLGGGKSFIHGIRTDGTLWAWGYNVSSTLGINATGHKSSPVQIPGNWTDVTGDYNGGRGMKSV